MHYLFITLLRRGGISGLANNRPFLLTLLGDAFVDTFNLQQFMMFSILDLAFRTAATVVGSGASIVQSILFESL